MKQIPVERAFLASGLGLLDPAPGAGYQADGYGESYREYFINYYASDLDGSRRCPLGAGGDKGISAGGIFVCDFNWNLFIRQSGPTTGLRALDPSFGVGGSEVALCGDSLQVSG
jgi:hypothetical protein